MRMIAIDTETTGTDLFHGCKPFAISMCTDDGKTYFYEFPVNPISREPLIDQTIIEELGQFLLGFDRLIFHNSKFDIRALANIGLDLSDAWGSICDTLPRSHVLDSGEEHGLKPLSAKYLDIPMDDQSDLQESIIAARRQGKKLGWNVSPIVAWDSWMPKALDSKDTLLRTYSIQDAVRTMLLYKQQEGALNESGLMPQAERERRLLPIVYKMEQGGITLKPRFLKTEVLRFQQKASDAERDAMRIKPGLNIRSGQQMNEVLFQGKPFSLPVHKASVKTGLASVDAESLETLLDEAEEKGFSQRAISFLQDVMRYRKANTAVKYLEEYQELAIKESGTFPVLHPSLNQVGTTTTRFSHSHPNTANVGVRDPEMQLRAVFGPDSEHVWFCIDYSQLELRILAVRAKEPAMQRAFDNNEDIHEYTARLCDITRKQAKNTNYAIVYGAGKDKLGRMTGVPDIGNRLKAAYPGIDEYSYERMRFARKNGYIETLGGYRLYVPQDRIYVALNYDIQGSAGVILKDAMINVDQVIAKLKLRHSCRLIMTIHDELVIQVRKVTAKHNHLLYGIVAAMERAGSDLGVRTPVEVKIVRSKWSEPKPISLGAYLR